MSTMTESRTTTTKQRPIVLRLPFSPEPISPVAAPLPLPDHQFAFKPGVWERVIVCADLDRESRELLRLR